MSEKKNNHSKSNEPEKSKKKTNFFLKGINQRFFHKNKTIGKPKSIAEKSVFKKSNDPKKKVFEIFI